MNKFTVGIVVFPGSNCDRDVFWALDGCLDIKTKFLWHESPDLSGIDICKSIGRNLTCIWDGCFG